jgi:PII-like signaling protein
LDLEVIMQLPQDGALLRIFIGEADIYMGQPLYEWIVLQAHEQGLAGATVLRGMMGFGGGTRRIQKLSFESLSQDLPVVVEVVDTLENLEQFIARIEPSIRTGLATLEKARIKFYRFEP